MTTLSRWASSSLELTPEQLPNYQISIISIFVLSLCTLIFYLIISNNSHAAGATLIIHAKTDSVPRFAPQNAQKTHFFHFLLGFVVVCLWLGALVTWSVSLGSVESSLRNDAMIHGLLTSHVILLYVLLAKKTRNAGGDWSVEGSIGLALWFFYAGMLFGTLGFARIRRETEV